MYFIQCFNVAMTSGEKKYKLACHEETKHARLTWAGSYRAIKLGHALSSKINHDGGSQAD